VRVIYLRRRIISTYDNITGKSEEEKPTEEGIETFYGTTACHCTRHAEPEREPTETMRESELVVLTASPAAGHGSGGTQVWEAGPRYSSNCWAVGRAAADSFQHDCNSPHRVSVKPRDEAFKGFPGRSPRSTAHATTGDRRWWNGTRPLST